MTDKGINNTVWSVSPPVFMDSVWIISRYRDRFGLLWGTQVPIPDEAVEALTESGYIADALIAAWIEFKRFLESRYSQNQTQVWVYANLGPRTAEWYLDHPGYWDRWHPPSWEDQLEVEDETDG